MRTGRPRYRRIKGVRYIFDGWYLELIGLCGYLLGELNPWRGSQDFGVWIPRVSLVLTRGYLYLTPVGVLGGECERFEGLEGRSLKEEVRNKKNGKGLKGAKGAKG